jgi:hypothetical protein
VERTPEQRVLEASTLLPSGGAVTGWGALRLLRGNFFDGVLPDGVTERPVMLVAGPGQSRRPRVGVAWLQDRVDPSEIWSRHGIPCVCPERALFDEMRTSHHVHAAVVAMDMAAAAELTSIRRMAAYVSLRAGWNGVPLVRSALKLADEQSRSPNETRMRLIWMLDAQLPRPLVNRPVWSLSGDLLGYADLLDQVAGVVGEYDGAEHRAAVRHSKDVAREDAFRRCGLEYFKVTGPDMRNPSLIVDRMLSTRNRATWLPPDQRLWTTEPPGGWEVGPSLDELLEERDIVRRLHHA